jgi:putative aldouronate transport system substrate-binding protein
MNKKPRGLIFLITAIILVTSLAGCKQDKGKSSMNNVQNTPDPVELKVFLFGSDNTHYRNIESVIKEFQNRTKNTLNITLKITFTPPAEYKQKLPLWIASGEDMDLVFDSPSNDLEILTKDRAYADLGKYFNNTEYPGLKKAFSGEYIENNKFYGKNYAIPITNTFMDMEGVIYRKDLLDKYNLKPISSYDDLYYFLTKVSENEKDMQPYGSYGTKGFFRLFQEPSKRQLNGRVFSFLNYIDVAISSDGKSVSGIAAYGDSDDEYKGFDPQYGKQYYMNYFNNCAKFNKFIPKDALSNPGGNGKDLAAYYTTLSSFTTEVSNIKAKNKSAELEFWPIYENSQKMLPGAQATDYKAWNFLCVPATSKKIDRTMEFLDWVFSSQENNDLFTYGIEGVNWIAEGTNLWKVKEGVNTDANYKFPGYELTWSPMYHRTPAGVPENIQKYFNYEYKPDTFKKTVLAGFDFNQEPVKAEIAICNSYAAEYLQFLQCGLNDPETNLKNLNKELKESGVEKIKAELKNQINDFLAGKK